MRIATFNVNGIRASQRRGFTDWLTHCNPDVVLLQEVRCKPDALPDVFGDYWVSLDAGTILGRNGVAVLTKTKPVAVRTWASSAIQVEPGKPIEEIAANDPLTLDDDLKAFSHTGRWIEVELADFPLNIASLYLPKGDSVLSTPFLDLEDVQARYDAKMSFLSGFGRQIEAIRERAEASGREFIVGGDFNIAHENIDLKNWKSNQKSSGFLPEERAWFTELLAPGTLIDVTRALHPNQDGPYSWWSWRGKAFLNNAGWRIDYQLATPALASKATAAWVDREEEYTLRRSDHAAVVIDYDF